MIGITHPGDPVVNGNGERFLTGQAYLDTAYTKLDTPIGIHQGGVMDRPATAAKVVSRFAKL